MSILVVAFSHASGRPPEKEQATFLPSDFLAPLWWWFLLPAKFLGWSSNGSFLDLSAIRFLTQNQINLAMFDSHTSTWDYQKGKTKIRWKLETAGAAQLVKSGLCGEHGCSVDCTWACHFLLLHTSSPCKTSRLGICRDCRVVCHLWRCAKRWLHHPASNSDAAILNEALNNRY